MAKNALFHNVTLRNGHGDWVEIVPGRSAAHVRGLMATSDTAVVNISSLGWHVVEVLPSNVNITFRSSVNGKTLEFHDERDVGYGYLEDQFRAQLNGLDDGC